MVVHVVDASVSTSAPGRNIAAVLDVNGQPHLVITSYLHTQGGAAADLAWCTAMHEITTFLITFYTMNGLKRWGWIGDFNFQPSSINGQQDKVKVRRQQWDRAMSTLREAGLPAHLVDKSYMDSSYEFAEVVGQCPWATQCDGMRGIDLALVSASIHDTATLIIHNGTH